MLAFCKQIGKVAKYPKVIENRLIYFNRTVIKLLTLHCSNRVDMPHTNISFQVLVDYFNDNVHENNFENNA